jgi:hypothetical protein
MHAQAHMFPCSCPLAMLNCTHMQNTFGHAIHAPKLPLRTSLAQGCTWDMCRAAMARAYAVCAMLHFVMLPSYQNQTQADTNFK